MKKYLQPDKKITFRRVDKKGSDVQIYGRKKAIKKLVQTLNSPIAITYFPGRYSFLILNISGC